MAFAVRPTTRVTNEHSNGAIRSWFDPMVAPQTDKAFVPRALAHDLLSKSAELFRWQPSLADLKDGVLTHGSGSYSVRFTQEFKDIPVDASEIVVNMYDDSRVYSVYNNYHYDIPRQLDPRAIRIDSGRARAIAEKLAREWEEHAVSEPKLIVYQYHRVENPPKRRGEETASTRARMEREGADGAAVIAEGTYFLAWDVRVSGRHPTRQWRILIDASSGRVIQAIDMLQYESGTGQVFDPNPIVTSGNTGLSSATPIATLDGQRIAVTLDRLDAAIGGNLRLHGSYVQMKEIESPTVAEPLSMTGDFGFSYTDAHFLNTMAYFHLDRFQDYVQNTLGMSNVANFSIPVDPQGVSGADNSFYDPVAKDIEFGGGIEPPPGSNPVPDAGDAMVVLHEYGHAVQDNVNPGFNNGVEGTGEGFGDFLAAVFYDDKHAVPAQTRGIMMSWDANTTDHSWAGRRYDVNWLYGDANYNNAAASGDPHLTGQFWCASTFELYRKLGGDSQYASVKARGRDLAIRLHLAANFNVPSASPTFAQMAQQMEAADGNLGGWRYANGLHKKVIYDTFRRRQVSGYTPLPVDVYINDGRHGGYGSLSGNDAFTEKLFLDNYWSTQDLWVTIVPYASASDQQAGDPGDHVEPPVGSTAYLYVRAKNKGSSGSGPVTVKAYHADPAIGLVWPSDWLPNDTPSDSVADIPAGGQHVFGPFPWTPTHVGHECVFAIAECANDHAVTQDLLPTDVVAHADLVPFDNNIAQRNLDPTQAKGKTLRGFWVSNPTFERAVVKLHFDSTLPRGWHFHTNLANTEAIHLAPRERRWVEVTIDQGVGAEIIDFTDPPQLTISGTIDGRLIGGMSFYAAPPSAFPGHKESYGSSEVTRPDDLFCLNIPWKECEIEGEVDIKLRFRHRKDGK